MAESGQNGLRSFLLSRSGLVLVGFLAVAGYFLWTEHEAHLMAVIPYLPFLLLLACPLMHLFMHHGHGGHGDHHDPRDGGPPTGRGKP
jgi:hypothetical protein